MFSLDSRKTRFEKSQSLWLDTSMVYANQARWGFEFASWAILRATHSFWWGDHGLMETSKNLHANTNPSVMLPATQEEKGILRKVFCDLEDFAPQPSDQTYRDSFVAYQFLQYCITRFTQNDGILNSAGNKALSALIISRRLLSRM